MLTPAQTRTTGTAASTNVQAVSVDVRAVSGAEVPVSQPAHRRYRMGEEARGAPHMSAPAALAASWVLTQTNVVIVTGSAVCP